MKKLFFMCFLVSFMAFGQSPNSQKVSSKIEKVLVFNYNAQVSRSAKVRLEAGKTELVFEGISPHIEKQSIQVKTNSKILVNSVQNRRNMLAEQEKSQKITQLEQEKNNLNDKIDLLKNKMEILENEKIILSKNHTVSGANTDLKVADLKAVTDFHRTRLTEIVQQSLENRNQLKKLEEEVNKINAQLHLLQQSKDFSTSEIVIGVSTENPINADFEISYLVKDAGWFMTYDMRVEDISKPVEMLYKANIYQNTGEDWQNILISLSTGNPTESGVKPTLPRWNVGFGKNNTLFNNVLFNGKITQVSGKITNQYGESLPGVTVFIKGTSIGTVTDIDGSYNLSLTENAKILVIDYIGFKREEVNINSSMIDVSLSEDENVLSEVVVMGYGVERGGGYADEQEAKYDKKLKRKEEKRPVVDTKTAYKSTTMNYEIKKPYTVLNGGGIYTADIKNEDISAFYQYYAVPKLDKDAFLVAGLVDWQSLDLVEGEINLFFEGAFLGKSVLDLQNATDTLLISLGRDKNVQISRNKLKEYSKKSFLGSNRTETRAWEIVVRNTKKQDIDILIEDQFPVSVENNIEVEKIEYKDAQLDSDHKLSWKLRLKAQEERKLSFKFAVKYPKSQTVFLE